MNWLAYKKSRGDELSDFDEKNGHVPAEVMPGYEAPVSEADILGAGGGPSSLPMGAEGPDAATAFENVPPAPAYDELQDGPTSQPGDWNAQPKPAEQALSMEQLRKLTQPPSPKADGRLAAARGEDRKRQDQDDLRMLLLAAGRRESPHLRNLGNPEAAAVQAQMAREPKPEDPLNREMKIAQLKKLLEGDRPAFGEAEKLDAYLKESESRRGMYDRSNLPKTSEPKPVDQEKRDAEIEALRALAEQRRRKPTGRSGGKAAGERNLSPATVLDLADFETSKTQLRGLASKFKDANISGPLDRMAAKGSQMLGLSNDYTQYMDAALLAMQGVGKIMEGGKLQAGDETKYRSLLPQPGESAERASAKTEEAIKFLDTLRENRIKALKAGGFKMDGVQNGPPQDEGEVQADAEGKKWRVFADGSAEEVL